MTRRCSLAATPLTPLLLALALASSARAATVEYLHVEAGEGNSAGGHAAIRFADAVYHFQHREPGVLVPARTSAGTFFWKYGVHENRTIRSAAVSVDDATFARLRDHFNTRYLVDRGAAAVLETVRRDRALLDAWAGSAPPDTSGLAAALPFAGGVPGSPALAPLRAAVTARLHPVTLDQLVSRERQTIEGLDVAGLVGPVTLGDGGVPDAGYRLSERWLDLVTRWIALTVLADARRVHPAALLPAPDDVPPLGAGERAQLRAYRDDLARRLAHLIDSARPDWGLPLLVGMARLQAIETSLERGRLVVVAPHGAGSSASTLSPSDAVAYAREHAAADRRRLRELRLASLGRERLSEQDVARLERTLGELVTHDARAAGAAPAAPPDLGPLPRPALDAATLALAARRAAETETDYEHALRARLGYGLLDHNCVTEIFRTIDGAFTPEESRRLLGGHVGAELGLGVVPARSFSDVVGHWAVVRTAETPSYRARRIDRMCRDEPDVLVHARESNVLTSTLYRPTREDSAFLFFTDDAPMVRPLYGLANLAYGTAAAGIGVVTLPLDRGRTLRRGVSGVVASVPELAFVSIRKGRMLHGPERAEPD
jgi:hypothetical protein